jgi:predicted aldo/keto reductase-like oxidoreductase
MYNTHTMVREAIKGLPREQLWIQTKMWWSPDNIKDPLATLERYRKELNVDYMDSLLIHCTMKATWTEDLKGMMEAFDAAQEKKLIRLKGVSCHGYPALQRSAQSDWPDVQLARVNPQGKHVDSMSIRDAEPGMVGEVMKEIKTMHAKGRGIIGMKLIGNGDFTNRADRERAMRFAMASSDVDAVVIGFGSTAEIDEALDNMNRALKETA